MDRFRIRHLAVLATLFMLLIFTLMPRILLGSAYADMRLVPYMLAIFVLAIRFKGPMPPRFGHILAYAALAFLLVRTATTTASLAIASTSPGTATGTRAGRRRPHWRRRHCELRQQQR